MQETMTLSSGLQRKEVKQQQTDHSIQQQQTVQTMWHKETSHSLYRVIEIRERRITYPIQWREEEWRRTWQRGFLKRRTVPASVSPTLLSISSLLYTWKEHNAMYFPIKILSDTGEGIEIVEALLDSGASGKFIDQDYAWVVMCWLGFGWLWPHLFQAMASC